MCQVLVSEVKDLSDLSSMVSKMEVSGLKELEVMEEKEWAGVFNMVSTFILILAQLFVFLGVMSLLLISDLKIKNCFR